MKRKSIVVKVLALSAALCLLAGALTVSVSADAVVLPDVAFDGGGVVPPDDTEDGGKLPGDVNGDNGANIIDVMMIINIITGAYVPTAGERATADINGDTYVNILDAMVLINQITGA